MLLAALRFSLRRLPIYILLREIDVYSASSFTKFLQIAMAAADAAVMDELIAVAIVMSVTQ